MDSSGRLILHVDVDAFFASVEQLLVSSLRRRPVVVGSGVIASCSYEARRFGLRAGMPLHRARRLCPGAVFVEGRYPVYRCFTEAIWVVCRRYVFGLETYLDEAYGDATGVPLPDGGPEAMGRRLQCDVREQVGLPVSVGLAGNRMLAKIASASGKPGGVVHVRPGDEAAFLDRMPVAKLLGVGPKTHQRLADMNVRTVADLRRLDRAILRTMFGRRGEVLYDRCRGRDATLVRPAAMPRSISRETTFHVPTCRGEDIRGMLFYLLERAMRTLRRGRWVARCVELSIRYDDWKSAAAARSLPEPTDVDGEVFNEVLSLLERLHRRRVALRHVGVMLSSLSRRSGIGELFEPAARVRRKDLHRAIDDIRHRWGHAAVITGQSAELLGKLRRNDEGFILRTPSLTK